ncbi:cystathionine beta-l [Exidia glandulosa HHB12029]|uniref:Cystathionine beta-lyase n=1 Tax=Exidia glandulosa HHB12029 TaxID=1314781 RepID=A0A165PXB7_EXIGL|nr:cystathionine beta-l [Exidia glandulosa HHB12029]
MPLPKNQYGLLTPDESKSPVRGRRPYSFATICATVDNPAQKDQHGSSSVPIYQSATFKGVGGQYDYSRSGNPTRSHLVHHLAKMYSARHAFAVSSGMAALDVITRLLKPGDEVIAGDDLYGGTNRLLVYMQKHTGIIVHHVDTTVAESIFPFLSDKTAMVLVETPTNPLIKIADLPGIIASVRDKAHNAVVIVDNTMMSPYLQRPLEMGADIVYDSGTKYLSGHHDLMAGIIACNRDDLAKEIGFVINAVGNALSPFDSFLLLRGTKTLAIRMDRQQSSAMAVAHYLSRLGFTVYYPGLVDHPGRALHESMASGPGAVLSFVTDDVALSERIVGATRLWGISVSFGAVNSLISMPCVMSHASIDPKVRAARGLPEDLIRLCVGIEDAQDLIDDLEHALLEVGAIILAPEGSGAQYVRAPAKLAVPIDVPSPIAEEKPIPVPRLRETREWFVSAPGKVILFGEHAVVHGVTAVAASVDLRCYGLTSPRHDGKLSLNLPDVGPFYHEWELETLPWDAVTRVRVGEVHPPALDVRLVDAIIARALPPNLAQPENRRVREAVIAFLYLYMSLQHGDDKPSFHFAARSALPVGAGLGSSASYSTCVATALLLLHQRIVIPPQPHSTEATDNTPGHAHVNRWAYVAEKVLHGTPSGVDNAVAVYGGALTFSKGGFGRKAGMEGIQGFKSLKFLLTDSRVPRDTKSLVAGVSRKKEAEPEAVDKILHAIQTIADEAQRALADPELPRDKLLGVIAALIDENHDYLRKLGVSHPVLEKIRALTVDEPFKLSTKLTGAGGGGCAVTLIPDTLPDETLEKLSDILRAEGFLPYTAAVGGSGLGVLSPYYEGNYTPPDSERTGELRKLFETTEAQELAAWAEGRGRWLFV